MTITRTAQLLTILIIIGMMTFSIFPSNAETPQDNTEPSEKTADINDKDEKDEKRNDVSKVIEISADEIIKDIINQSELNPDDLAEKIKEQLSKNKDIKDVKVVVSDPTIKVLKSQNDTEKHKEFTSQLKKLAEDKELKSDEFAKKVIELVKKYYNEYSIISNKDGVIVYHIGPNGFSNKLKNTVVPENLMTDIQKIVKDDNLNKEQKVEKIIYLVKNFPKDSKFSYVIDDVLISVIDSNDKSKIVKYTKADNGLEAQIKKLLENKELDKDQLVKKIIVLLKDQKSASSISDIVDIKVLKHGFITANDKAKESDKIKKLMRRINKLEKKIDKLMEKYE